MAEPGRTTYLLVDGENIDGTLGGSLRNRRPNPDERPRWQRVREFAVQAWQQPVTALFLLNASTGQLPASFVQALLALDHRPIPLAGDIEQKVADIGIQRTLDAIEDRGGDVLLASHDGDFVDRVTRPLDAGRKVGMLGFPEFMNAEYHALKAGGCRSSTSSATRRRSTCCCHVFASCRSTSSTHTCSSDRSGAHATAVR